MRCLAQGHRDTLAGAGDRTSNLPDTSRRGHYIGLISVKQNRKSVRRSSDVPDISLAHLAGQQGDSVTIFNGLVPLKISQHAGKCEPKAEQEGLVSNTLLSIELDKRSDRER